MNLMEEIKRYSVFVSKKERKERRLLYFGHKVSIDSTSQPLSPVLTKSSEKAQVAQTKTLIYYTR